MANYQNSNYRKKKKKLISQNTKVALTLATFGIGVAGISMADYFHEKKEFIEEQENISSKKSLDEIQEEILRNNATSYDATDFLNNIATLSFEDKTDFIESLEGQYVEMTGTIMSVSTDNLLYEDHFTLGNTNPNSLVSLYGLISCDIEDKEQKEKLKEVEAGDIITVTGKYYNENPFSYIGDCIITDIEKGDGEYNVDLTRIYN